MLVDRARRWPRRRVTPVIGATDVVADWTARELTGVAERVRPNPADGLPQVQAQRPGVLVHPRCDDQPPGRVRGQPRPVRELPGQEVVMPRRDHHDGRTEPGDRRRPVTVAPKAIVRIRVREPLLPPGQRATGRDAVGR